MYSSDQSDSYDYQDSISNVHSNSSNQRNHRSPLQQLISLNVRIFNGLGFNVTADNFRAQRRYEDQDEQIIVHESQSQNSEVDYGESEDESEPAVQVNDDQQEISNEQHQSYQYHSNQSLSSFNQQYIFDESLSYSNNDSPFFLQPIRQEGLSKTQINNLPTMQWSHAHNVFNRGQKCPVCLQEFQMGNKLRVMECLHRYHIDCLDEWLTLKASCPSCRNPPNRQGEIA